MSSDMTVIDLREHFNILENQRMINLITAIDISGNILAFSTLKITPHPPMHICSHATSASKFQFQSFVVIDVVRKLVHLS